MNSDKRLYFKKKLIKKIILAATVLSLIIFFCINIFYQKGFTTKNIWGRYGFFLFSTSILIAGLLYGLSSSSIQFASRNILASPATVGIFPSISFSYIIASLYGFQHLWIARHFIALGMTILCLSIFFIIDIKVQGQNKIVYSFVIAVFLASVSIIWLNKLGIAYQGNILFAISELIFTWTKLIIGICSLVISLIIYAFISRKIYVYNLNPALAKMQGINIIRLKVISYIMVAIASCGAFTTFGFVSFLGLIVPNIVRILGFEKLTENTILSSFIIAIILSAAYFISRTYNYDLFSVAIILSIPMVVPFLFRIRKVGRHE